MDRFDDEIENWIERVIGCAIEVHRKLGPGLPEVVYGNALEVVFKREGIPYEREHYFEILLDGVSVGRGRMDFWVANRLVVEDKAKKALDPTDIAQVVGYLSHKKEPAGLLLNFNVAVMKNGIRRVVRSKDM
jgi:GxxExxY protein